MTKILSVDTVIQLGVPVFAFFFNLLAQKPNLEKIYIYSIKFFHNFHLSESSFTCPWLRPSGLAKDWSSCHLLYTHYPHPQMEKRKCRKISSYIISAKTRCTVSNKVNFKKEMKLFSKINQDKGKKA